MNKIEKYFSLPDKEIAFEQINIKYIDDLKIIFTQYIEEQTKNKFVFRGCSEAYFKLYNSSQRAWTNDEISKLGYSYTDFIKEEIRKARNWQNNLLEKFYGAFGYEANDLIILGFLQHYKAPTPLLDWTYSFENSLYFATESLNYIESKRDIENYFSIYVIDLECKSLLNLITHLINKLKITDTVNSMTPIEDIKFLIDLDCNLDYKNLCKIPICMIPGYQKDGLGHKFSSINFKFFYNQQNLNIINQQGLFMFNSSEDKPLEYFFHGQYYNAINKSLYLPKIKCYNIHKSLNEFIQSFLIKEREIPINKEFIYPQEETIASKVFEQFFKSFNAKNE